MVSTVTRRHDDVSDDLLHVDSPPLRERLGEPDYSDRSVSIAGPSFARRASRALVRFVFACGIGVAATLAWQSYGDAAKQTIAAWGEQQGWSMAWLREEGAAAASSPPAAVGPAAAAPAQAVGEIAPGISAADLQQLKTMTLGAVSTLTTMRERLDQLASAQFQTASDIAKLQASEQEIRQKMATPPSRPAAPPSKPAAAASPRAPAPPR